MTYTPPLPFTWITTYFIWNKITDGDVKKRSTWHGMTHMNILRLEIPLARNNK